MHAAAVSPRGGVARRAANLRGQSIIEYVLIIAVIGLVIVFAGTGVAGAIRNQFNLVGNTVNSGTSAGAEDIAAKGEASPVYAKAKAAMDAGTTWSVKLTNDDTMTYRIIGINHDDLADGSGKAGLTFLTTSTGIRSRMNATDTNVGGWEKSELRAKMNSGEIWNLMPSDFQSKVKPVRKLTNNVGGGKANKNAAVTATTDRLFLLSYSEIVPKSYLASDYPWTSNEGTQYEAFRGKVTENHNVKNPDAFSAIAIGPSWWERTVCTMYQKAPAAGFLRVKSDEGPTPSFYASYAGCVCPVWSF